MNSSGNLLVVDWDFFFPMPKYDSKDAFVFYDWGHAESPLYIKMLWGIRAGAFIKAGKELPHVNDEWRSWWERFNFDPKTKLFIGESNAFAVNPKIQQRVTGEVWLFDAHHDCGYNADRSKQALQTGSWSCEDWMIFYGRLLGPQRLHVRYPEHRVGAFDEEPKPFYPQLDRQFYDPTEKLPSFDTIFVCRSGAWVPSWEDGKHQQFIELAGRKPTLLGPEVERSFDMGEVEQQIAAERRLLAKD